MKRLGFRRGTEAWKRSLQETERARQLLLKYLTVIGEYRATPAHKKPRLVFTDESYIYARHNWYSRGVHHPDDSKDTSKAPAAKGARHCFIHAVRGANPLPSKRNSKAASDNAGLVPGAFFGFNGNYGKKDYHQNFNGENFVKWFTEELLPNLTEPSLIILDNAKYHRTPPPSAPKVVSMKKKECQDFLTEKGVAFSPYDCVAVLKDKVRKFLSESKTQVRVIGV